MRRRKPSIPQTAALAVVLTLFMLCLTTLSSCSSTCGSTLAPLLPGAASTGCGDSGHSTPAPSPKASGNIIQAECTRVFEGPDNGSGEVTAYVQFSCPFHVDTATLTVTIFHTTYNVPFGTKPTAYHTCQSIEEGMCSVSVPCTEGRYRAAFILSATVDGQFVPDAGVSTAVTYSAGDCTL